MITLPQFLARADTSLLAQLTSENATVDEAKVLDAIDDARKEVLGYTERLPEAMRPSDEVLDPHQVSITWYKLAGNRAGIEYPSIAERYKAAIRFLERLGSRTEQEGAGAGAGKEGLGVTSVAPAILFDDASMSEFGREFF